MLVRINRPNHLLLWIVINTDAIVSIVPDQNMPNHCLVKLLNQKSFHLELQLLEKLELVSIPVLERIQDAQTVLKV
jgi:hypothetical protein